MDDYIDQILAEMPDLPLHDVVKNIMDKPIPETVKVHLLQPLRPGLIDLPPPTMEKEGPKEEGH